MQFIAPEPEQLSPYYPKAVIDYLSKAPTLDSFYDYYPNREGYGEKITNRTFLPKKRKSLAEDLKKQYGDLLKQPGSELVKANIAALANENSFTVTTGQQIHIYLGPLYVTNKILTAVARCRWLAENIKGYTYVPVFWMATEDHDFEEISKINLYNRQFSWPATEGYTGAVGNIPPQSINALEKEIAAVIENDEEAKALLALFTEAYTKYPTLADATRYIVHTLFGHLGVVVVDANDKKLKNAFNSFIKEDIFSGKNYEVVTATTQKFEEHYKPQVQPREINFFYLTETGRHRLVQEGEKYIALDSGIEFDAVSLTYEIDQHPERFSPNVIMRPLYQEVILPNIAYIGGAGEISYWLQLSEMFKINGVQFPVLELRKSLIVLNERTVEKIGAMGYQPADFLQEEAQLQQSFLAENSDGGPGLAKHYANIAAEMEQVKQKALQADASLKPFIEGEFKRVEELFDKLDKKLEKTEKRRFEGQMKHIETIKNKFFNNHGLAERTDTLLSYPFLADKSVHEQLVKAFNQEKNPLIIVLPPLK